MPDSPDPPYASRSGHKLAAALDHFAIDPSGWTCADLGSNVGGFVDVLLRRGSLKVYAVDTGYGVLAYRLRKDPRVVVMERTNAMHVELPEPVDLVTIDVAWTTQRHILPAAKRLLKPDGRIMTLIKPHYEADKSLLQSGVLPAEHLAITINSVLESIRSLSFEIVSTMESPIAGTKGNIEYLALLRGFEPTEPVARARVW